MRPKYYFKMGIPRATIVGDSRAVKKLGDASSLPHFSSYHCDYLLGEVSWVVPESWGYNSVQGVQNAAIPYV